MDGNPDSADRRHREVPSSIKDANPRSLAEAQLLCKAQVLNLQYQNLFASILPVLTEAYALQQLKKANNSTAIVDQGEAREHTLHKKMLTFTSEIVPKVTPVMHHLCKDFVQRSEAELLKVIRES